MPRCRGCEKEDPALIEELCSRCRTRLGLTPAAIPALRPARPCHRCGGLELVQCLLRERGASGGDMAIEYARPLALAHGVRDTVTFWAARKNGVAANLDEYHGALVAYVCRSCGFTELYTLAPQEIPIGPEHGTRLIKADEAPYR